MGKRKRHLLREFYEQSKKDDPKKTYAYWAKRWKIEPTLFAKWLQSFDAPTFRRISPRYMDTVFKDLPFSYEEYLRSTPASSNPPRGRDAQA
jgi:hypothetical protein